MKLEIDFELISCPRCMMTFAITKQHDERLRECHNTFYCPSGHNMSYSGQTEAAKLRRELEREKATAVGLRKEIAEFERKSRKRRKP